MKKALAIIITIMLAAGFAACSTPAVKKEAALTAVEQETPEPKEALTPEATPRLTPEPTPSPAEVFAKKNGVTLPDIKTQIITDTDEVEGIILAQPYWSSPEDDTDIIWYRQNGRYMQLTSIPLMDGMPDIYGAGKWFFEGDVLVLEPIEALPEEMLEEVAVVAEDETSEQLTENLSVSAYKYIPVMAEFDNAMHLYLCCEEEYYEYIHATEEEKLLVSADPEPIANLRYFLCSATWLLAGHYDEEGNYSHRPNSRAYTFLADGQIVVEEDGESVAGYYTLNFGDGGFIDLNYQLENGQKVYSPIWADNSSSYASAIFLYPEYMSNASDVYMAKHKYNVSDYVNEGEPIPVFGENETDVVK